MALEGRRATGDNGAGVICRAELAAPWPALLDELEMSREYRQLITIAVMVVVAAQSAHGHGLIGKRFFPATLTIEDPFVADELALSTVFSLRRPEEGGGTVRETVNQRRAIQSA